MGFGGRGMRLAAFNVENLFDRPKPMNLPDQAAGSRILDAHAELTGLLQQTEYTPERKTRILQLLDALGLLRSDTAEFAVLRRIRGRLLRRPPAAAPSRWSRPAARRGSAGWN